MLSKHHRTVSSIGLLFLGLLQARTIPDPPKPEAEILQIPRAAAATVDGVISPGEWDQAMRLKIVVAKDWIVTLYAQHDGKNLYLAYTGLKHNGRERYPEVLFDPENGKTRTWTPGQWWLHASYNLCESNGRPDDYASCKPAQQGWTATRFPLQSASEFAISLDKIGLSPGKPFGLAFDVTDTHGRWAFWPRSAKLKAPVTWRTAQLQ
jgi:hypothetical protein